ncbi:MAG: arginine--tRNA ligase [Saprospiraceae bacterium]|nr:arginine--tRNA ligase [Bacteroidia bacterium]NNE16379.1 arginine--tRNA ligase [Saprospiraceae bacterium]NNL93517.1 arginine--tRNA ligase [Saprospiraceae bacterium]
MLLKLKEDLKQSVQAAYDVTMDDNAIILSPTKKEFNGDYTFVVFPLVKTLKNNPQVIAETIGNEMVKSSELVDGFNVVKGFLNLSLTSIFWDALLNDVSKSDFGIQSPNGKKMMVEFSSPNTNKPLHLGHIRNILLGWSISQIAEANGYEAIKTQIINDRGIAVCKSMISWQKFGKGETPQSTGIKGDHFVGKYYVQFEKAFQEEYKDWQKGEGQNVYTENRKEAEGAEAFFKRYKNQYFNEFSKIGKETKAMLIKWESGDEETVALWEKMNNWVYEGFEKTYQALGVSFDSINYESETYLLGKATVEKGLKEGLFYKKDDGSVWVDLEDAGMDHKIILRSDGTSVYMTQDLGTAQMRYEKFGIDSMIYTVADEQDYHFKVLFEILKRLGEPYADQLHHLSYGMVDLTTGKMKSREGTVVDADDLVVDVFEAAKKSSTERGGLEGMEEKEKDKIYNKIGLAALKYFIIKINPRKRMTFDPNESVDMQGTTGPYIQNAYVRIQSVLRKVKQSGFNEVPFKGEITYNNLDKEILVMMESYPSVIAEALEKYDPSVVANYCYTLAKSFHRYYHDNVILDTENPKVSSYRINLATSLGKLLAKGMKLLGIEMPDYM